MHSVNEFSSARNLKAQIRRARKGRMSFLSALFFINTYTNLHPLARSLARCLAIKIKLRPRNIHCWFFLFYARRSETKSGMNWNIQLRSSRDTPALTVRLEFISPDTAREGRRKIFSLPSSALMTGRRIRSSADYYPSLVPQQRTSYFSPLPSRRKCRRAQ